MIGGVSRWIARRVFGYPWRQALSPHCAFRPRWHGVRLTEVGLDVPWGEYGFVLEGYRFVHRAKSMLGAQFELVGGVVRVEFDGLKVGLSTLEELFILDEIFVRTCYGWRPSRPTMVVDVGCNTGLSCLYFARKEQVRKVVGFEPFPRTIREAERNLMLNPDLARKIELRPFGLGARDDRIEAEYSFLHKGRVSPVGGLERVRGPITDRTVVAIEMRDSAVVIEELLAQAGGLECALKLDCEGSEYDIVARLGEGQILERFRTVFIEWHGRGPDALRRTLADSGFSVLVQQELEEVGFIYAVR